MEKSIDTLVEDIYELFEKGADLSDEFLESFGDSLISIIKDRFASFKEQRKEYLRFSNLGKNEIQLYYDINGYPEDSRNIPEPLLPQTKLKFLYGDIIEQLVLLLAKQAGHKVSDEQRQVEIDGLKGSIDALIDGEVVDIKSASGYGIRKFANEDSLRADDSFGYVTQLSGYAQALEKDHGYFIVLDKERGGLQLCKLERDDIRPRLKYIRDILDKPEPPKSCDNHVAMGTKGNRKLVSPCIYCKHKSECHPGLRVFEYSTGLTYLTKVVEEPRVSEFRSRTTR